MKKRKQLIILFTSFLMLTLTACGLHQSETLVSGDLTEKNITQVCNILRDANLSNVDVFQQWVRSAASGDSNHADEVSGFSDADCRMTVMLLAGDQIRYNSTEENYTGNYLMFDLDAIENNEEFLILKENEELFTTMFGEMPISASGFADSLPDRWNKHGIQVDDSKWSIISILFKAYKQEEAFVGHTGILIDCRDLEDVGSDYLFLEKIAFGDPFKITWVNDEDELIGILSERADYTVEDDEPSPVVYKNGEKIGELKR